MSDHLITVSNIETIVTAIKNKLAALAGTIPVIDSTLTQTGQAADAKKVGDEIGGLKSGIDKFDNPFETTIDAYTSGIVKMAIIDPSSANYSSYRISTIRKNSSWHLYMTLQGYDGEAWVKVDDIESAYVEGATYPRVETIVSKYNRFTVTIDWNYVIQTDLNNSSLTTVILKNNIVFKPFTDALANIKTIQNNIVTLTSNEQRYNTIFSVNVPDSILGLVDISIYNPNASNYQAYRVRNVRHNSSWHIQLTVQGYTGESWVNVDEVELSAANAPNPVPDVEVYDSNYHRLCVTIVWALMGSSITLTNKEYTLKHGIVDKTQIGLRVDVNKALTNATIPPFELADHIARTNVIKVDASGNGDFTTIGAAYASITDSAFDNQYEIVVYPGTYNENNLIPPIYTHTHGIYPMQTIVDSSGLYDAEHPDYSVFDQQVGPSKLSNMVIRSQTKYCVHQDIDLYGVTLVNENLYCERLAGGNPTNSACIGMGADFGGAKFIWRGCTFVRGEVGMHTNPNNDPNANQQLIFEDCIFVNAYVWLGVAGNTKGNYLCDIRGCRTNRGNAGIRLKFGAPISDADINFPWHIIGGNNNFAPLFDNTSDTSVTDYWEAIATTEKAYVIASEAVTKDKFVTFDGKVADNTTEKSMLAGKAVSSGVSGDKISVWSGPVIFTGANGEYGIDSNGDLSINAAIKTGVVINNIYYPFS